MSTATEDTPVADGHTVPHRTLGFVPEGRSHWERTSRWSILLVLMIPVSIVLTALLIAWLSARMT